ncbi:MAG: DUF3048 domain-containing protein [Lachnospiraceae bacterium]|nr:DUF3048 domain-containing protein [Lachnospiraceae bacterium]
MKKMKVLLLTALSVACILSGCGNNAEETEVPETPVQEEVVENEPVVEEIVTDQEPEAGETLPAGKQRSSLTGEIIDESLWKQRPLAIMLPTDKAAQPQYGIGNAGVLYECMEEGDMSRQMAIIEDWHGIKTLGNVRSCRDYYVYWALEWDPILVHFGGPFYLADVTKREDVLNITGCAVNSTSTAPGCNAFYRTSDKAVPHNAYTSGEGLVKECEKLGYGLEHNFDNFRAEHFVFATDAENTLEQAAGSFDAKEVSLAKAFPYTKSSLEYDEASGLYKKNLYEAPQCDGTTGEQLTYENVVIQFAHYEVRDAKGYLSFQCHDTTKDGYYITNGKAVHVVWGKKNDYSPTRFYYDDMTQVEFNPGKTFIAVVQNDRSVTIDGVEYKSQVK